MKKYELLLVLPGTLDDNQAKTRAGEVLALIKEKSEEAEMQEMGKARLAYPIKQIRYGYYYTIVFSVEPAVVQTIQAKLSLSRDLLRAIVTEFNAGFVPTQKIAYATDNLGVTTMGEGATEKAEKPLDLEEKPTAKVSIQDINKKLDEILDGDIIPGV